jgi:small-conductance mechanosensitive channel
MAPILPDALFGLPEWASRLTSAGLVIAAALLLLWLVAWLVPRLLDRAAPAGGVRARNRSTLVHALASALRYLILVLAVVAVIFALAGGGIGAVTGSAVAVVVIGFAFQRLLGDIIAGFLILFEDQYGVGDTISLEPSGYVGRVESVGLRATELTGAGGERMIVPNGAISGVRVIPDGRRGVRIEALTRDPDALEAAVHELAGALAGAGGPWDAPARVVRRDAEDGLTRLIAVVELDPSRGGAPDAWLADALAQRAGDLMVGPPLVLPEGGR